MKRNWLTIIFATALIGVVLMLWDTSPKDLISRQANKLKSPLYDFPYAVISNASSKYYNEQGELNYAFDTEKLEHYRTNFAKSSADDYMLMHKPVFTLLANEIPWHITADKAKLNDGGETLVLWDNVHIWQERGTENTNQLTTSMLTVKPNEKLITTDAAVQISGPNGEIEAVGMQVDLNKQIIRLLSKVRGFHEPI